MTSCSSPGSDLRMGIVLRTAGSVPMRPVTVRLSGLILIADVRTPLIRVMSVILQTRHAAEVEHLGRGVPRLLLGVCASVLPCRPFVASGDALQVFDARRVGGLGLNRCNQAGEAQG